MDEFEVGLERASQSLAQFVDGPGVSAARALEEAFSTAGQNIEQVLKQAAQSGELDFQRMTRTILADLARILTEALSSAGSIATLIAAAAARGARYA